MNVWTGQCNGHILSIMMDKDKLHQEVQDKIDEWKYYKSNPDDSDGDSWNRCRMTGTSEEPMTADECIADLERFDHAIDVLAEKEAEEVLEIFPRKKNGTFKKSVRPRIDILTFGTLYEEAYGWETTELRMRSITDTEAVVELNRTTIHW